MKGTSPCFVLFFSVPLFVSQVVRFPPFFLLCFSRFLSLSLSLSLSSMVCSCFAIFLSEAMHTHAPSKQCRVEVGCFRCVLVHTPGHCTSACAHHLDHLSINQGHGDYSGARASWPVQIAQRGGAQDCHESHLRPMSDREG